jgi:predicted permease
MFFKGLINAWKDEGSNIESGITLMNKHSFCSVTTIDVSAVLGRTASLPCDIEPSTRDDRVYMVLWFRETSVKSIYRFVPLIFIDMLTSACFILFTITLYTIQTSSR